MATQVHWHEGLFLQPHHLQKMQKNLGDMVSAERRLAWPYPYGIVEAHLSADELENMRIHFDRLRAVMPSGLEVNFPADAELPSMDIKQALASSGGSFAVYLGVPLWMDSRANTVNPGQEADARVKVLYRLTEIEAADENTGENRKALLVRRTNARLLLENEDTSDLEVIPLLRIVRATGQDVGLPRQDTEFAGPCLVLNGSPGLRELVHDLSSQVEASRKELVIQLARGGFNLEQMRGLQFEQMMRLRTLNRFCGSLPSLVEAPSVSPFTYYLELRELLGELSALHPDRDDEFQVLPYDHDSPFLCFGELCAKIRSLLRGAVAASFLRVQFAPVGGLLTASFTEEHFTKPNDYFLGIETKEDSRALAHIVENPDEFKLMPASMAARAIRGVPLNEERFQPLELPAKAGLYYFRLQRNNRAWDAIRTEKAAVIRWPEEASPDYTLSLYMTVPSSSA